MIKIIKNIIDKLLQPRKLLHKGSNVKFYRPYLINHPDVVEIGSNSIIHKNVIINPIVNYRKQKFSPSITIGKNCYIGLYSQIHAMGHLIISDNCVISDYLYMNDALHSIEILEKSILENEIYSKGNICIGNNCFIGYDVTVLSGVNIGHHCVVASKSLVNKSFPPYSMIAGNPAIVIKNYDTLRKCWIKVVDV